MPLPVASTLPPPVTTPPTAYPAIHKTAADSIDDIYTTVTSVSFSDNIMITITQEGRLVQWIRVPLDSSDPNFADQHLASNIYDDALLPMAHLTPKTLLGGSNTDRATVGQLYATQIATAILTRNPDEKRALLVGIGLSKFEAKRDVFYDTIDLAMKFNILGASFLAFRQRSALMGDGRNLLDRPAA
ncbi:MAG: hypothetical protein Q9217_001623 [Psora testacea]